MNIEHIYNQKWYLAQYITGGKNRENLFSWLGERHIIPWTPLTITQIKRADAPHGMLNTRSLVSRAPSAVFPTFL